MLQQQSAKHFSTHQELLMSSKRKSQLLENSVSRRNKIFEPMVQNKDKHWVLDDSFVTANVMIKCEANWQQEVFDNFNNYVEVRLEL